MFIIFAGEHGALFVVIQLGRIFGRLFGELTILLTQRTSRLLRTTRHSDRRNVRRALFAISDYKRYFSLLLDLAVADGPLAAFDL